MIIIIKFSGWLISSHAITLYNYKYAAYPMLDLQVQFDGVITIRARSGSTVILPPYIRSGIWHSRYYIDWEKQGGETVGRIDGFRSPMLIDRVPEGFSVDPADFSLMIESVSRSVHLMSLILCVVIIRIKHSIIRRINMV